MAKKEKQRKICFWMPERWIKLLDSKARYLATTRTELLRNLAISLCLKGDSK